MRRDMKLPLPVTAATFLTLDPDDYDDVQRFRITDVSNVEYEVAGAAGAHAFVLVGHHDAWMDVLEAEDSPADGSTLLFQGGRWRIVAPVDEYLVLAGRSSTTNPDVIVAGGSATSNPDVFAAGGSS